MSSSESDNSGSDEHTKMATRASTRTRGRGRARGRGRGGGGGAGGGAGAGAGAGAPEGVGAADRLAFGFGPGVGSLQRYREALEDRYGFDTMHLRSNGRAHKQRGAAKPRRLRKRRRRRSIDVPSSSAGGLVAVRAAGLLESLHDAMVLVRDRQYSINRITPAGGTPLTIAAGNGYLRVVQYLISNGADANAIGCDGDTPVLCACRAGHTRIVEYLLNCGALLTHNDRGESPMYAAAAGGHVAVVRLLLGLDSVHQVTKEGESPLGVAARLGHIDVVRELLRHPVQVRNTDHSGATPLLWVCRWTAVPASATLNVARILVRRGADTNALEFATGESPLLAAARYGSVDLVHFLLSSGASVGHANVKQESPLLVAAQLGEPAHVSVMLSFNANVDASDGNGNTPLMHAIACRHGHVVDQLLGNANLLVTNNDGVTLLMVAAKYDALPVVVAVLEKEQAPLNAVDMHGDTALIVASRRDNLKVVRRLIKAGADVDVRNNNGETALQVAARYGHAKMCALLVTKGGANVNAVNNRGYTALGIASHYYEAACEGVLHKHAGVQALDVVRAGPPGSDVSTSSEESSGDESSSDSSSSSDSDSESSDGRQEQVLYLQPHKKRLASATQEAEVVQDVGVALPAGLPQVEVKEAPTTTSAMALSELPVVVGSGN